jgi:hypothetical protein
VPLRVRPAIAFVAFGNYDSFSDGLFNFQRKLAENPNSQAFRQ